MPDQPQMSPSLAALAQQIERDLGIIRRHLRKPLEAEFARGGLTVPQLAVMQVVVRQSGISLKDLSRAVSLAHSTVSGIVDRLGKRGLLERRPDPADGRVVRIHPTPQVTGFLRHQMPRLALGPLQNALRQTSASHRKEIAAALELLRRLLEQS